MDRAIVTERLAQAERHVADGIRRVADQRGRVERLEPGGHAARKARRLLAIFVAKLTAAIADWDRLAAELRGVRSRRRSGRKGRKGRRHGGVMSIADDQD